MEITQLDKNKHDRTHFDCEVEALNNFLKKQSSQGNKRELSRTFVLTSEDNPKTIQGYYALASCVIQLDELPEGMRKHYPNEGVSCALIGRLARDKKFKGQGIGDTLLIDAIKRAVIASDAVPTPMIIIDAKTDKVANWYKEFGFVPFPNEPRKLMLSMKNARTMLKDSKII